ncbi:site-specific integrase [Pedobacter antarcticus]|uniref:site-specific integrase n=1 Tax=Pedobacter antarcticus TaxID=34086 RepID=UPI002931469A|nr:site-specific integrase [Pedobacter antarcticus]
MSKVTVRRKAISKGRHTIYLDHYPPIYNPYTGKLQRTEYLKLYTFDKPLNSAERLHNKETSNLVEYIRASRQIDIQNRRFGFLSDAIRDSSFIEHFRSFMVKKQRSDSDNYAMALRYFIAFAGEDIKLSDLNDFLCEDYKHFLLSGPGISRREKAISKNTAVNYFAKFRSVLKEVFKRGLIDVDLYKVVLPIKPKETHRDRLEIEEFQRLASTPSSSDLMKRAALFSGLTGLRFSDVQALTYSNIKGVPGRYYLQYIQDKTENAEVLPISDQAVQLIGKRGEPRELVFDNLKYSNLKPFFVTWLSRARVYKNITFHSFRHTYATLQLEYGTDIFTLSKLLGHKSLKSTQVYAKIVDRKKTEAAGRIVIDLEFL